MAKSGKKLAVAVVVLVIAIALATTATFAWFTMNQDVSVGNIDMNVTSNSGGLYISLDGTEFKTELTTDEVRAAIVKDVTGGAIELDNVTYDKTSKKFNDEGGTEVAKTTGKYAQFTVYFRGTEEMDVALVLTNVDKMSTVTSSHPTNWEKKAPLAWEEIAAGTYSDDKVTEGGNKELIAKGSPLDTAAANAARVSFATADSTLVWNPNSDKGFNKGNLANDYSNNLLGTNKTVTEVEGDFNAGNSGADKVIITLAKATGAAYYEGSITINVWLEGTDGDCLNSILSDTLKVSLNFVSVLKTA